MTVQNVYGTTLSEAQTVTVSADGSYAVPVTTGANIIAVTTAAGTDYQIVRARKISYTITNNTTGKSEGVISPSFSCLVQDTEMARMAGRTITAARPARCCILLIADFMVVTLFHIISVSVVVAAAAFQIIGDAPAAGLCSRRKACISVPLCPSRRAG